MRLLVIEDHRDIAENVADYFEPKGHVLDFAADGLTGLRLALTESYDAIVLDLMLPGMDGITVCKKFRSQSNTNVPILMLTARDQLENKLEGFTAGADDYLVKPFAMKELEARLIALEKRAKGLDHSGTLLVGDLEFDTHTLVIKREDVVLDLNPTMRRLLAALMQNSPGVVSRRELEYALWGDDPPLGDILRAHIHSLRVIVDKPFKAKLIHTVHGSGYRLAMRE